MRVKYQFIFQLVTEQAYTNLHRSDIPETWDLGQKLNTVWPWQQQSNKILSHERGQVLTGCKYE